jgi:ketosteroid isomerase-like protein
MKKFTMAAILMMAFAALAFAQTMTKAEMEVLKINKEYDAAVVKNDVKALERILADDYVYTDTDGSMYNKMQDIELAKSGDLKFEYGMSDDVKVRVYGETAIVTGRWMSKGSYKGKTYEDKERYTSFYVKRAGRWQLVSDTAVNIREENKMMSK